MEKKAASLAGVLIAKGQMPQVTRDKHGKLHLVFGRGDSILYVFSDDGGYSFSNPAVIGILPNLNASDMRGPQIASSNLGISVIAGDKTGNIFCYSKSDSGNWQNPVKVNDADTSSKEGLMAMSGDGAYLFAVWLDLRDKHNKLFGARSTDGGKTWSKNLLVYASPDSTVCECCKPSVVMKGNNVFVMFRNWLKGNRDLYLIQSSDSGYSFGEPKKLGNESWALNGCPMDGGALVINRDGVPETVWLRKSAIYACEPGRPEIPIGKGRSCSIETVNGKNIYTWTENGEVVILNPLHEKIMLGKGQLPVIKSIDNDHVLCVWENENKIFSAIVPL